MRHRKISGKLNRSPTHRKAMLRNLATELLRHERVQTTRAKAREVRRVVERMITLAKRGNLHARRQAASVLRDRQVVKKLFDDIAYRYRERPGGYTRITKLGCRQGDNAALALIELVPGEAKAAAPAAEPTPAAEPVEEAAPVTEPEVVEPKKPEEKKAPAPEKPPTKGPPPEKKRWWRRWGRKR